MPVLASSLRILVCSLGYTSGTSGGAEQQAQLQAEELARRGHQVDVVCPRDPGTDSGTHNGVRVYRLPYIARRRLATLTYLPSLARFLTGHIRRYDAVMVHLAHYQADVAVIAAQAAGRPSWVRLAASGPLGEVARMRRGAEVSRYYGLRHATRVQAISDEIAEEALAAGVQADRLVRVPNGVNLGAWSRASDEDRALARKRLHLLDRPTVLFVGRLAHQKGVLDLLDGWDAAGIRDATLVFVGSFATIGSVVTIPPRDGIVVRDRSVDIRSYYQAADLLVLPARSSEGMSNALLEGMASGLPVVATSVGAAADLITSGKEGLIVPPRSPTALRDALALLLGDGAQRIRMGEAGRRKVERCFSIEAVVDKILDALVPLALDARHPTAVSPTRHS